MKKVFILIASMLVSLSAWAQYSSNGHQSYFGASFGFGSFSDYSAGLVNVTFGKEFSDHLDLGLSLGYASVKLDETKLPGAAVTPFVRYNYLHDGPVALFAQFNLAIGAIFPKEDTYGVIWPHLTGGLSYRMSEHFTAFAQMGLLSKWFFVFSSSDSGSGSGSGGGSGSGYDFDDEIENGDYPLLFGATSHPTIGIYYTF